MRRLTDRIDAGEVIDHIVNHVLNAPADEDLEMWERAVEALEAAA